jgi:hypothetical protein
LFENADIFSPNNFCEIQNTPLHEVIIKTLSSFEGFFKYKSIDELFKNLIEPINEDERLIKSLRYLQDNNIIISNGDLRRCTLTRLGNFASKIPNCSSNLSRMIYYGIMMGLGEYAILIATILIISERPFRQPSLSRHAPDEYNDIIRNITNASYTFDRGSYSELICFLNIYQIINIVVFFTFKGSRFCQLRHLPALLFVIFSIFESIILSSYFMQIHLRIILTFHLLLNFYFIAIKEFFLSY